MRRKAINNINPTAITIMISRVSKGLNNTTRINPIAEFLIYEKLNFGRSFLLSKSADILHSINANSVTKAAMPKIINTAVVMSHRISVV